MTRDVIAETTLRDLRLVGIGQRRALDAWDQITAFVATDPALGPRHAALFAEPVIDPGGRIDWYADCAADAVIRAIPPASDDPQADDPTAPLRDTARQLIADIHSRANALKTSPRDQDRRLGETLLSALMVPEGHPCLYAVDDQPVLVNWGSLADKPAPNTGVLEELVRPAVRPPPEPPPLSEPPPSIPPPAAVPASPTPPQGTPAVLLTDTPPPAGGVELLGMLLWALFAALVAAILALLLWGCALGVPWHLPVLSACPGPRATPPALAAAQRHGLDLQAELDRLDSELRHLPPCPRPEPVPESEPEPEPAPPAPDPAAAPPDPAESEFDRRREEAGGAVGAITVTLIWDGDPDLDLWVLCPDGSTRLYFRNKAACGGQLDVDANASGTPLRRHPVENVVWPAGGARPAGTYTVMVDNFSGRSARNRAVPFRVRVQIGDDTQEFSARIAEPNRPIAVTQFSVD